MFDNKDNQKKLQRKKNMLMEKSKNHVQSGCIMCGNKNLIGLSGFCIKCEKDALAKIASLYGYQFAYSIIEYSKQSLVHKPFDFKHIKIYNNSWVQEYDPLSKEKFYCNITSGDSQQPFPKHAKDINQHKIKE